MAQAILNIRHLSKSFGQHLVLRDIDFTVNKGDVISIIGASGSGKSTLLRCVNLLETPTSGKISFQDKDIDQMITWAKKEANPLYPVPVVWARKDFRRLIESIRK